MLDLLYQGGPLFMGILSLLLLLSLVLAVRTSLFINNEQWKDKTEVLQKISNIKSVGMLALVIGILGQLIGLYSAFDMIEASESGISQQILVGGLRVSMITTMYGLIIFLISRGVALFLNNRL